MAGPSLTERTMLRATEGVGRAPKMRTQAWGLESMFTSTRVKTLVIPSLGQRRPEDSGSLLANPDSWNSKRDRSQRNPGSKNKVRRDRRI